MQHQDIRALCQDVIDEPEKLDCIPTAGLVRVAHDSADAANAKTIKVDHASVVLQYPQLLREHLPEKGKRAVVLRGRRDALQIKSYQQRRKTLRQGLDGPARTGSARLSIPPPEAALV